LIDVFNGQLRAGRMTVHGQQFARRRLGPDGGSPSQNRLNPYTAEKVGHGPIPEVAPNHCARSECLKADVPFDTCMVRANSMA
jgi:hypothetical protein